MIGQVIDHYRVTGKLGEGGMGTVYRADDLRLQRPVALKFVTAGVTPDADARQRVLNEARAASRLNHPNIAVVYEVGEAADKPFIAMEMIEGETLKQVLARGVLPAAQLMDIARQIAEGLHEAHQHGVLHRDLKPGNVMLDARRRVKILDFGLAILTSHERAPNESVEIFATRTASSSCTEGGTAPYMAPERLSGEPTGATSDIFSFGVILYECLTGRLPFPGRTTVDIMHAILHDAPIPLRSHIPEISPHWERLVDGCIAKAPLERFRSMRQVLDGLAGASSPAVRPEKSVAVLYFENLSTAKDDEYFRDGMTEDIITQLSKIRELRVFPRSAVLAYRDKPVTAPEIGQQLNAMYVLVGSLRRAANRLRITAQLVEAGTGHSIWAERYDRQLEDVFAIQDEIAQHIAGALQVMLTEKERRAIEKPPTSDVEAYDYYLRGRQHFHQFRRKGFELARQMFNRALEIDPRYARAYSGVADCCSFLYMYWDASQANLDGADLASRKALELDPDLAEAHVARGLAVSRRDQNEEARLEFETAIRLNPKLWEAYYFFARVCFAQGDAAAAARHYEQAERIRPDDYQVPVLLHSVYRRLGRESDMQAAIQRGIQLAERHLQTNPNDSRALCLGATTMIEAGSRERGLDWATRAIALDPDEPLNLYNVACIYSLLDRLEEALDCLERAVKCGYRHKRWLDQDSDLDPLRAHPRFQAIMKGLESPTV